jgi:hypothetical protein
MPATSSVHPEIEGDEETRRDMIKSAVAGMQRFKQSWYSVMILKAGIGLGQVSANTLAI